MRKIFIDVGGHVGESIRYFRKHHDPKREFQIYTFEPLPENADRLREIDGVTVIQAAASSYDGSGPLFTGMTESGSLSDKKRTGGLNGETSIIVKTINFSRWFHELVDGSEVIIKLNCEGAEYDILMDMWAERLLHYVSKWFIQWHWNKIGMPKEEHDWVTELVQWESWPAMFEK